MRRMRCSARDSKVTRDDDNRQSLGGRFSQLCPHRLVSCRCVSATCSDQLYDIWRYLPQTTQAVLVSATMPHDVLELTTKFMNDPVRILVKRDELTLEGIKQVRSRTLTAGERRQVLLCVRPSLTLTALLSRLCSALCSSSSWLWRRRNGNSTRSPISTMSVLHAGKRGESGSIALVCPGLIRSSFFSLCSDFDHHASSDLRQHQGQSGLADDQNARGKLHCQLHAWRHAAKVRAQDTHNGMRGSNCDGAKPQSIEGCPAAATCGAAADWNRLGISLRSLVAFLRVGSVMRL